MTRRLLLFGAAMGTPARAKESGRVPTDEQELNRFAAEYNAYVSLLHNNVVDVKAWKRVKSLWRGLAGE